MNPLPIECVAGGTIVAALLAFATIRIACDDVAWHLATARVADQTGAWPITNTFSHTFPDYPLFQQYPFFQALLYSVFQRFGWPGLSVLLAGAWLMVFLAFVRWSGGWRPAAVFNLLWMLGLLAAQRRMILRPDMLSAAFLGLQLLAIDLYLRHHRAWIVAAPMVHLLWANSHQLFPISLVVQSLLIIHLCIVRWATRTTRAPGMAGGNNVAEDAAAGRPRWSIDPRDRAVPIWPALVSLTASIALTCLTPLGIRVFSVILHTGGSLAHHRQFVRELAPIWERPVECTVAGLCGLAALTAFWLERRRWRPFELGLWLLSLALVLAALRAIAFFGLISIGLAVRTWARRPPQVPSWIATGRVLLARRAAACLTLLLCAIVLYHRWIRPPLILGGSQPGVGRSRGDWPDAAIDFLRRHPPPGEMLNLPWSTADALLWALPERRVFVDPRLEAYPRAFLIDCLHAPHDDDVLNHLIQEYQPMWIFTDHRQTGVLGRVAALLGAGDWRVVHVDSQILVLVRLCNQTSAYLSTIAVRLHDHIPLRTNGHAASASTAVDSVGSDATPQDPADLLPGPPQLRCRQRIAYALALATLGYRDASDHQLHLAATDAKAAPDHQVLFALIDAARARLRQAETPAISATSDAWQDALPCPK